MYSRCDHTVVDFLAALVQMEFVFDPSVKIRMKPSQYLFGIGKGKYCLGIFDNGAAGSLIGGISVRDVLVQVRNGWMHGLGLFPMTRHCQHYLIVLQLVQDTVIASMGPIGEGRRNRLYPLTTYSLSLSMIAVTTALASSRQRAAGSSR